MKTLINIIKSKQSIVLFDQGVFSGLNFSLTLFLAKFLSIHDFSYYATIILFTYLAISVGNALILQPFQVAKDVLFQNKSYANFLFVAQICFIAIVIAVVFVVDLLFYKFELNLFILFGFLFSILLHDFFRKYYLASNKIEIVFVADGILAITQVFGICLIYMSNVADINFVLFVVFLSYLFSIGYSFFKFDFSSKNNSYWDHYFSYHKVEGFWLGLVSLIQWGSGNLFVISLGLFVSIEALGAFRLVQSLFGVLNILFQTFENYVLPRASKLYSSSVTESKVYLRSISVQSIVIIGLMLLVLFFYSSQVMYLFSGDKYMQYSYLIKGMCLLYFILFVGYPIRLSIRMLLLNKVFFNGYLISFVFSSLGLYFLVKYYQMNGVIFGLIINQLIMLIYWNHQLHKKNFYLWK